MSESKIVNADQVEFWESATGRKWIEQQEDLDALLAGVLDHLLAKADIRRGQSVLDIGCGTGASVLAVSEFVGPDGSVEGLDIASQMLECARQRLQDAGIDNARLTKADAQVHPFEPLAFDHVVSRFGVMFFDDPVAAFANIARTVKPGGRLTLACWASMDENPWFAVPRIAAMARLGHVAPLDPTAPGPMAFEDTARVIGLFQQAGLPDARAEVVNLSLLPNGGLKDVAHMATSVGPALRIMKTMKGTEADAQAIAAEVATAFEKYVTPEGVRVPARLNYYSVLVP